jgi:hypothetical protein
MESRHVQAGRWRFFQLPLHLQSKRNLAIKGLEYGNGQQLQPRTALIPRRTDNLKCKCAVSPSVHEVIPNGTHRQDASKNGSIVPEIGSPEPLGPSPTKDGVNFAVFSENAKEMSLCLFDNENNPITELKMTRTDTIWHVEAKGCPHDGVLYGVRVSGEGGWETGHRWDHDKVLLDPYSPLVSGRRVFGVRDKVEQFKELVWTTSCHDNWLSPEHRKLPLVQKQYFAIDHHSEPWVECVIFYIALS